MPAKRTLSKLSRSIDGVQNIHASAVQTRLRQMLLENGTTVTTRFDLRLRYKNADVFTTKLSKGSMANALFKLWNKNEPKRLSAAMTKVRTKNQAPEQKQPTSGCSDLQLTNVKRHVLEAAGCYIHE